MKRSEALDMIKEEIEKALVKYGSSGTGFKVAASYNILVKLEEAGMYCYKKYDYDSQREIFGWEEE